MFYFYDGARFWTLPPDAEWNYPGNKLYEEDMNGYLYYISLRINYLPLECQEGRPIVGDCARENRRVSDYVDHFFKPLTS